MIQFILYVSLVSAGHSPDFRRMSEWETRAQCIGVGAAGKDLLEKFYQGEIEVSFECREETAR